MASAQDPSREQPNRLLIKTMEQIIKNQAKMLRDHLTKIEIFMMTAWMLNFMIAFKDSSKSLDKYVQSINFTFRKWTTIDGVFNLISLFPVIILSMFIQKWKIQNLTQARANFFLFYRLCGVLILLKLIWISIGSFMFMSFNNSEITDLLSQFMTVYFVGFYGGLLYLIHFYTKKRMYRYFSKQYQQREGRPLLIYRIQVSSVNENNSKTYKQLIRNKLQKFSFFMVTIVPIFNIAFYIKDQSQCMYYQVFGNGFLVFRSWNLTQFILLLMTALFYNLVNFFEGLNQIKQHQYQNCLKVAAGTYILLILADITIFIFGMVIFLNLDFATCSSQLIQFYVYYFLAGINLIVYVIISFVKEICTMPQVT